MSPEDDEQRLTDRREVERFLKDFKEKMEFFQVTFWEREKNNRGLLELGITPNQRKDVLKKLEVEDYTEGPFPDRMLIGSEVWVFGRRYRDKELYIKISLGHENAPVICVSFHIAEHPMDHPFKEQE